MAGKLSFSIAINLLTENFKRGTGSIKNGLRAMQMQVLTFVAALGVGGIGLTNLVTRLIDVARETNRVTTSLKNVSGSTGLFADNQRYLLSLAKKYGLEINALTGNFAKFTASASISGMSLLDQRKIFESVARACTAFGMSADDSNGVFLALSQMMSKGKISSEELRLQMGERLPIALQAMAKAAGVSVGDLDKLMKQGKLMSADVLPKFADALSEMIPNVDTDNLETSINRLKNAFTEFSKETNIQRIYKGLIDWLTGAVQRAGEHIKRIVNSVVAFIVGVSLGRMFKWIVLELDKSQRAAMIAASKSAKAAGTAFDEVAWRAKSTSATVIMAFSRIGRAIKTALISALPTAIFVLVGELIAKFVTIRQEATRIKNIFSDYRAEIDNASHTPEIAQLQALRKLYNEAAGGSKLKEQYQTKIVGLLGGELDKNRDINEAIKERIGLLESAAKADIFAQQKANAEIRKGELLKELSAKKTELSNLRKPQDSNAPWYKRAFGHFATPFKKNGLFGIGVLGTGVNSKINAIESELSELDAVISDASEHLGSAVASSIPANIKGNSDSVGATSVTTLQKAEERYAQSLRDLDAKREVEKMSLDDYNKAFDEINRSALIEAKASNDASVLTSEYIQLLQKAVDNPVYSKSRSDLEKVEKEYKVSVSLAREKMNIGLLSQQEYNDAITDAAISAANSAIAIEGIGLSAASFIERVMGDSVSRIESPVLGKRDTTFDYKTSDSEKISGELDVWNKYRGDLEDLKQKHKGLSEELQEELTNAIKKVPTLEKALKLAQVKEDISGFSRDLGKLKYDGLKDVVSNIDHIASSFERLQDAFDPEKEASGWEKIMAVWGLMTGVVDSLLSVCKTIEAITDLSNKLAQAKQMEAAVDTATTTTKVVNAGTQAGATIALAAVEKEAATEEVAANTAAGASKAGKSAAGLPFPWNIVAIGGAIAAALAAFALIPKFAGGGIISGGPSSGDKILARVNSGEMILNKGQQSTLFGLLNGRGGSAGSSGSERVIFKIKDRDLVGFIDKTNNRRRRI